jgi:hypothetical protein
MKVFQFTTGCEKFSAVITESFKKADPLCPHIVKASWDLINKMGESEEGEFNKLYEITFIISFDFKKV